MVHRDHAHCPVCNYPLRGLRGERFDCPECGQPIDLALMRRATALRWFEVPGTGQMQGPGCALVLLVTIPPTVYFLSGPWPAIALAGLGLFAWGLLTWHAISVFRAYGSLKVAVVAQVGTTVLILGLCMMVVAVVLLIAAASRGALPGLGVAIVLGAAGWGVTQLAGWIGRYVARQCLRSYVAAQARLATGPPGGGD